MATGAETAQEEAGAGYERLQGTLTATEGWFKRARTELKRLTEATEVVGADVTDNIGLQSEIDGLPRQLASSKARVVVSLLLEGAA